MFSNSSSKLTISKERNGSIVTKTLENRILISIDTLKTSAYYADSKYIKFIKFSRTYRSYEPEEIRLIFEIGKKHILKLRNHNENQTIRFSIPGVIVFK